MNGPLPLLSVCSIAANEPAITFAAWAAVSVAVVVALVCPSAPVVMGAMPVFTPHRVKAPST